MQTFARHLVSISAPRRLVTSCIQLTRSLTCAVDCFDLFFMHVSDINTKKHVQNIAESCRTLNLAESQMSNRRPNAFVSKRSPNDHHRPAVHSLAARVPHVFHPKAHVLITSFFFMSRPVKFSENTATLQLCDSISSDLCPL